MNISYTSTRSKENPVTASKAILKGLAPDGGLYVPSCVPAFTMTLDEMAKLSYRELALEVMGKFLDDFTKEELKGCIDSAYDEKFDTPEIAPVRFEDGIAYLELFHGATIAFKDMALSILPHLMVTSAKKNGVTDKIVILTATSGDTGKAAMAGFADVPGTEIIVFYPDGGVSDIQRLQMVTQRGENTHVVAIRGNFDDAQSAVKAMFGNEELNAKLADSGIRLSSANSINIGRLVPQIVYYVYAYCTLVRGGRIKAGDTLNVTVPTGNFGNILAAYYAKRMGLPLGKLVCASNENNVLTDFFRTGAYDKNRPFILTSSPSMDILISSNLERLLYHAAGEDCEAVSAMMESLKAEGRYEITDAMKEKMTDFIGGFATEEENFAGIRGLFGKTGYVIDPHTGIANAVARRFMAGEGEGTPMLVASTASPYKFATAVIGAIEPDKAEGKSDFELIDELSRISGVKEPAAVTDIRTAPVRHKTVVDAGAMQAAVEEILL